MCFFFLCKAGKMIRCLSSSGWSLAASRLRLRPRSSTSRIFCRSDRIFYSSSCKIYSSSCGPRLSSGVVFTALALHTSLSRSLPMAQYKKKKPSFFFSLRSPCTTLLREVRLRLGSEKKKPSFFFSLRSPCTTFAGEKQEFHFHGI